MLKQQFLETRTDYIRMTAKLCYFVTKQNFSVDMNLKQQDPRGRRLLVTAVFDVSIARKVCRGGDVIMKLSG